MKKRLFAILLVTLLTLSLFTACGNKAKAITQERAQQIALEAAGVAADQVQDAHIHITSEGNIPCFSVHVTMNDGSEFSILINAATGEVLSK